MPVKVDISWTWLDWKPHCTWETHIAPQLEAVKIPFSKLDRCVYVIRTNGIFAISYPYKPSPVIYIGEGNFQQRLSKHRYWLGDLEELVRDYSFCIGVALPRVPNNAQAYKDYEAALIQRFRDIHGSAPMANSHMEYRRCNYVYEEEVMREALLIGKGVRFKWAIHPMPSATLYEAYHKTHLE
ncbi:hypothetical protein R5W24_004513 [Gemmata sp. JC717]|uniref:hypothetical protein n=1 Tax=Gemmata algarum TaxID=2975278 RepID=UPI0021BAD066|nr:hypothetical protein [Gemmata algarum]MDY3555370.1 hypothetical protein [Gemmata algarum]